MKDYKLLLAGLILLLLVIFIAIFTWLWSSNRKNADPLPIMASENDSATAGMNDDKSTDSKSTLHIQAEENLQGPLDDVIVGFESRYPHVDVITNYVASTALLTLSSDAFTNNERSEFLVSTDMIIADGNLSTERLAPLQTKLTAAQDKNHQTKANNNDRAAEGSTVDESNSDINDKTQDTERDNTESRTLNSFNYALKDEQALEGVILTDNTIAVNFRNFLLSSTGQSILKKYNYHNIDGYQNSVDDLFNPTSRTKKAPDDDSVNIADALSNGK
ncbi:hypothetical protein ACT3TI_04725 [Psychrobacter sp. AOP22-C1-22]|uniref:hypothetical protein n=1 Tax=Psychrobacter TaxID=497 RepID=UPI0017881BA7|nr:MULTISPECIES: hypothetical protein [unclassified Psychrobacter]MBE0406094.1 hypothetical protein [Psychrobacter sp. FME6]MBE0444212.1 hypothetical protein [Psychrobacter sp. FME5]MDN5802177.1 hypothetical protein [Psychrobacter sp.]